MTPSAQIKLQLLSKKSADAFALQARQIVDQMRSLSRLHAAVNAHSRLHKVLSATKLHMSAGILKAVLASAMVRLRFARPTTPSTLMLVFARAVMVLHHVL